MVRIGAVSYLNTKPLVATLEDRVPPTGEGADPTQGGGADTIELSFDVPSHLADQLKWGQLDVALIPSVETFLQRDLTIVSDACIACHGPVWSVKLFSRLPVDQIRSVALDEGSRTSAALIKILLWRQFGLKPEFMALPIDVDWRETGADAAMVIGDRAIHAVAPAFPVEVDLGEWWKEMTGLPFVFAVWAARRGVNLGWVDQRLTTSRDAGLRSLQGIAEKHASRYDLTVQRCLEYFQHNLHFVMGERERRGLALFYEYAWSLSLVPEHRELVFHD